MYARKEMEGTVKRRMDGAVLSIIGSCGFFTLSLVFLLLVFLHMASGLKWKWKAYQININILNVIW